MSTINKPKFVREVIRRENPHLITILSSNLRVRNSGLQHQLTTTFAKLISDAKIS